MVGEVAARYGLHHKQTVSTSTFYHFEILGGHIHKVASTVCCLSGM